MFITKQNSFGYRAFNPTVPSTPSTQRTISITSERTQTDPSIRRVLSVSDPNSSQIIYSYATTPLNGVSGILPLKSVKRAGSGQPDIFTTYAYTHDSQNDTAPIGLSDQPEVFYHINVTGITDAGGKGIEFAYTHDLSVWGYNSEPEAYPIGWYLKAGLRKRISSITSHQRLGFDLERGSGSGQPCPQSGPASTKHHD